MKNIIRIFFLIGSLIIIINNNSYSQGKRITHFSQEENQFLKDLSSYMEKGQRKKEAKELIGKFTQILQQSDYYSALDKENIFRTANDYLTQKKALAFPHMFSLVKTLIAFADTKQDINNYRQWQKYLVEIINTRRMTINKIHTFIENTYYLITEKTIWKTPSVMWKITTENYQFNTQKKDFIITIKNTDLKGYSQKDSTIIYQTNGTYYPMKKIWKGEKGIVTWEKCKMPRNTLYAELNKYTINIRRTSFSADSVKLTYPKFFKQPILGKLEDKIAHPHKGKTPPYPKFSSYQKIFKIKNLFKNIDFEGGMQLIGNKINGSGDKQHKAKIYIYHNDTLKILARSTLFLLKPKEIISQRAEISLYLNKDSIYHPSLLFKYNDNNKLVQFIRNNEGLQRAPYINTYHQLTMDVQEIRWHIGVPKIEFGVIAGSTQKKANFKSTDYFSMNDYMSLQKLDMENPLVMIRRFTRQQHSDIFYDTEFANFMRLSIPATHHYLLNVAYKGFIRYDIKTGLVVVDKKLYDYLRFSTGQKDYDVIEIASNVQEGNNAELSLLNNFLKIHGVFQIALSDSQDVMIFPSKGEVVVKRNRNFDFDGKVRAGKMLFVGTNYSFNYDAFKIKLTDIKYIKMQVAGKEIGPNGQPIPVIVKNTLENTTGELLIDNPQNKSGIKKKDYPQYPIFKAMEDAFVYYDSKKIFNGVYRRDKFYFQIYPFEMDSLSDYSRKSVKFKGHFVSADIFPPFDYTLSVQKDYSLGFIKTTPTDGMPTYKGKSKFTNKIYLSNNGLRGNGTFDYLTSTTTSKDFIFFPDSMNTTAQFFENKKQKQGIEYPSVIGKNTKIHYLPYEDQLYASTTTSNFTMLDNQSTMKGTLILTPSGMRGKGVMHFGKGELISQNFIYKADIIDADTSTFNLKALEESEFAFKTTNVNSHIDFVKRQGLFKSNGKASIIEFPQNKYICYMDQFTWYMDKEEIELSASKEALAQKIQNVDTTQMSEIEKEDLYLEGTEFISIHPRQDSLKFKAPKAKYDLKNKIITAEKVKLIRVGDATVYPGDGNVVIKKNAKMQTLVNSKIIANNVTRYHTIYNCNTNIYGRKDYVANGDYDYIDKNGQKETIHFNTISLDTAYQTYAKGSIGITDNFTLSPQFMFTGKVYLYASKKHLTFDGYTKISHQCQIQKQYWIKFKNEIDPLDIYIPIGDTIKDINNNKLYAGFFSTRDTIYTTFLTKRKNYSDLQMLKAKGYLHYDKASGKYKIASKEKLIEPTLPGNLLSMHKSICNTYGEGKITFANPKKLGQVKIFSVGNILANPKDTSYSFDILMGINFFFNNDALKLFAEDLQKATDLEPVDVSRETYTKGLAEIVGKDEAEQLISQMAIKGEMKKIPEKLKATIFLSDLKLEWNKKLKGFISTDKIGIGHIGNKQINKMVDGWFIIIPKRGGTVITMFFKISDGWWYYFEYKNGVMRTVSSVEEYNTIISTMKPDDRQMKVKKGEPHYSYYPTTPKVVKSFLKRIKALTETEDSQEDNENE